MKIKEIPLVDVKAGKNWRFYPSNENDWPQFRMEDWGFVIETEHFTVEDEIIYSGLIVFPSGQVRPLLQLKTVGDADYGGDFCEYANGRWRQIGLVANPDLPVGQEYIANPLAIDPSFESSDRDYRKWHRDGFLKHAPQLPNGD